MSLRDRPSHVYDSPITGQPMRPRRLATSKEARPECWGEDGNYLGADPISWWGRDLLPPRLTGEGIDFSPEKRFVIGMAVLGDYSPPAWTETVDSLAAFPARAWWEWHWYRGIDPFRDRKPIPARMRRQVIERDGYVCGLCGGEVEPDDVHIDHILPVTLGGQNEMSNLQVAHSLCNISKGNRI